MVKPLQEKLLNAFLAAHHGVITLEEARSLGLTEEQVRWSLRTGRWERMRRGVYRRAAEPIGPEARLTAACLSAGNGAVASHTSAAWLWKLLSTAPGRPTITVAGGWSHRLSGVDQYRRDGIDPTRVLIRRAIPVTDPVRTLADLGEILKGRDLDDAIHRALAKKLVTVEGLEKEIGRLGRRGRSGIPGLRRALERRGFATAPHPSVLESRTLRLLRQWGITPAGTEVVVCDGRYRLDVRLCPDVALEVDGYAYHWSPEGEGQPPA